MTKDTKNPDDGPAPNAQADGHADDQTEQDGQAGEDPRTDAPGHGHSPGGGYGGDREDDGG
jgi:hypothetical protein